MEKLNHKVWSKLVADMTKYNVISGEERYLNHKEIQAINASLEAMRAEFDKLKSILGGSFYSNDRI